MRITPETQKKQCRDIYELLSESPRSYYKDIAVPLNINWKTAKKRLKEAFEKQIIVGPDIRKRSFQNLREYVYLIRCKNPETLYLKYREDQRIIYHAEMLGFCNLFLFTTQKIDIEGDIILEGYRSDYHVSYAPYHSWLIALRRMRKKTNEFDPEIYSPENIIESHLDDKIQRDFEDETLYRYFKYSLRKPLGLVMEEHQISAWKIYQFLDRLTETCTVFTSYYPETLSAYDPYLFMFEIDYEDFIIDLFSELPTSVSFSNDINVVNIFLQFYCSGRDVKTLKFIIKENILIHQLVFL